VGGWLDPIMEFQPSLPTMPLPPPKASLWKESVKKDIVCIKGLNFPLGNHQWNPVKGK